MKEFIEKLIGRLEEEKLACHINAEIYTEKKISKIIDIVNQLAEEYSECYKDCEQCEAYNKEKHYCPKWCKVIKNTTKEMVENESSVILMQLLEAKKNCSEDSYCSECPFGQIEDRCILAELQIKGGNNGWIPCSERLPDTEHISGVSETVLVTTNNNSIFTAEYHRDGKWLDDVADWSLEVIAWQPLPAPYKEGE